MPLKSDTRQGCLLSLHLFTIILEILTNVIRQKKETKSTQIGKEGTKLSFFIDGMIVYVENLKKKSIKQITEINKHLWQVSRYEVSIQEAIAFLYMNNEQEVFEM